MYVDVSFYLAVNTPGPIGHEDAFPYCQRAVVPHQQKVEDFISDTKQKKVRNYTVATTNGLARWVKFISPTVEKEEAAYGPKHQDYCHIKLELLIFIFVRKSMNKHGTKSDKQIRQYKPAPVGGGEIILCLIAEKRNVHISQNQIQIESVNTERHLRDNIHGLMAQRQQTY